MMASDQPQHIFLFSGKRKSGKDFFTNLLHQRIGKDRSIIIKISAPIKIHWAKLKNLDYDKLISSDSYKEDYRLEMINWSEEIRQKDPGYFCKRAIEMVSDNTKELNESYKPIWIISDVRRKTDIVWFQENFGDRVQTFRINTSNECRKARGWTFSKGIDDVSSECDLDDYEKWNWLISNNDNEDFDKYIETIISQINQK